MTPVAARRAVAVVLVLAAETYAYQRYAAYGAQFHFWLHGLVGGYLGMAVLVTWRLLRPHARRRATAAPSGFAGHLLSAVPDVLFVALGLLHATWMDVFVVHISLHFVPAPLLVVLGLWGLALLAHVALSFGAPRLAGLALVVSVAVLGTALALRDPIPADLQDLLADQASAGQWFCSVARSS